MTTKAESSEQEVEQEVVEQVEGQEVSTEEVAPAAAAPAEAAPYEPNFKYKVYDEEREMDEFIREIIKDKETEEKLRSLYCKAGGFDPLKEKYSSLQEKIKSEYEPKLAEYDNFMGDVEKLGTYLQQKDYANFLKLFNIADTDIMQYALNRAQYYGLPQDQRAIIDQQNAIMEQNQMLQWQQQQYEQMIQNHTVQTRTMELEGSLAKPEVNEFVQKFDALAGRQGAFRDEVIKRGQYMWHTQKVDAPVDTLIGQVMGEYKNFLSVGQTAPEMTAQPKATNVVTKNSKPTIPNVQGQGTSPTRPVYSTLDQLKAKRDELKQQLG